MPHYLHRGSIPPKRHTIHPRQPGYKNEGIHYEEVVTTQGFGRAYSTVYHIKPPTRIRAIEPMEPRPIRFATQETLRPVHLKTARIQAGGDPIHGRVPMMGNSDVTLWRCRPTQKQTAFYRNALAEEILFVQSGSGKLRTMMGTLVFRPFDYLVIPRCTTYFLEFDSGPSSPDLLVIESQGDIGFPARYLNPDGQFRLGAPFCERDIHGPILEEPKDEEGDFPLEIKNGDAWVKYTLAHHPFDAVGWDGMVYPFVFHALDFEPITGTVHQPPPIHQTFHAPGFVVCTFAPRMLDTHPLAIKVPYAHSNVESDEVLFYCQGQFGSRKGVEIGSITLHPHGIPHGPHPGTILASRSAQFTNELAVMVDTFRPLKLTEAAMTLDDPQYPYTWLD